MRIFWHKEYSFLESPVIFYFVTIAVPQSPHLSIAIVLLLALVGKIILATESLLLVSPVPSWPYLFQPKDQSTLLWNEMLLCSFCLCWSLCIDRVQSVQWCFIKRIFGSVRSSGSGKLRPSFSHKSFRYLYLLFVLKCYRYVDVLWANLCTKYMLKA